MRVWLLLGLLVAAALFVGGVLASGAPERTPVPVIELRGDTTGPPPTERATTERRTKPKRAAQTSTGGGGASPAPVPTPEPAGDDDDDDADDRDDRDQDDADAED